MLAVHRPFRSVSLNGGCSQLHSGSRVRETVRKAGRLFDRVLRFLRLLVLKNFVLMLLRVP